MKADQELDTHYGKFYLINHPIFLFNQHMAYDSIYFSILIAVKIIWEAIILKKIWIILIVFEILLNNNIHPYILSYYFPASLPTFTFIHKEETF